MLVRFIRRILGTGTSLVEDPITYNSEENINTLNKDLHYFMKMKAGATNPIRLIYKLIQEKGLLADHSSVVDVGCGFGNLLNLVAADYRNTSLLGTDFSESKIDHLRAVYPHIHFKVHNIYDALEGTFDLIVCTEVLEHLLYPRKALVRLVEALNSNGKVFITVPNGRLDTFNGHINFWSLESWNVFLEENITANYQIETGLTSNNKMIYTIIKK